MRAHELYSFSKSLLCYWPEATEVRARWMELSHALERCDAIEDRTELLTAFIEREGGLCRLLSLMPPDPESKGTGSPEKER